MKRQNTDIKNKLTKYMLAKGATGVECQEEDTIAFEYEKYYVMLKLYQNDTLVVCAAKRCGADSGDGELSSTDVKTLLTNRYTKYGMISVIEGNSEDSALFIYRTKITYGKSEITANILDDLFDKIYKEIALCYAIVCDAELIECSG